VTSVTGFDESPYLSLQGGSTYLFHVSNWTQPAPIFSNTHHTPTMIRRAPTKRHCRVTSILTRKETIGIASDQTWYEGKVKASSAIEGIRMKSSADSNTVGREVSRRRCRGVSPCVRKGSARERMKVMQERGPTWNLATLTSLQKETGTGSWARARFQWSRRRWRRK